ncbi:MAG: hypothetical protein PHE53_14000 [Thermoguttaceae bacterium]|nr:hypothetical protein [Thermoguttaceae bacterium]
MHVRNHRWKKIQLDKFSKLGITHGAMQVDRLRVSLDDVQYMLDESIRQHDLGDGQIVRVAGVLLGDGKHNGLAVFENNFWSIGGEKIFPEICNSGCPVVLGGTELAKRIVLCEGIPGFFTPRYQSNQYAIMWSEYDADAAQVYYHD